MSRKKRKRSNKVKLTINKAYCDEKKHVEKKKAMAMRYEEFHNHFVSYDHIVDYLIKMEKDYPQKVKRVHIGTSLRGKKMYMMIVNSPNQVFEPKSAVMIIAGLNGQDWMAVSNALFIIDYMTKNEQGAKIMDYYVIPCCNPDAYIASFLPPVRYCNNRIPSGVYMDLTSNFPTMLGVTNPEDIPTREYLGAIQQWKEKYLHETPECYALLNALYTYQKPLKLFISLQQGGKQILYPYGFGKVPPFDVEELKKVAWSGRNAMKTRCLHHGTIYDMCGLNFGNILDFIRIQKNMMKFAYIIQVTKGCSKKDQADIVRYGCDTVRCINVMCANVFKYYQKLGHKKPDDETKPPDPSMINRRHFRKDKEECKKK